MKLCYSNSGGVLFDFLVIVATTTLFGSLPLAFSTGLHNKSTQKLAKETTDTNTVTPTSTNDWKSYENKNLGFSFRHPPRWEKKVKGRSGVMWAVPALNSESAEIRLNWISKEAFYDTVDCRVQSSCKKIMDRTNDHNVRYSIWANHEGTKVKSGKNKTKQTDLVVFIEKPHPDYGIRFYTKNIAIEQVQKIIDTFRFSD